MNRRTLGIIAIVIPSLAACSSMPSLNPFAKKSVGLTQVDDVVDRIKRVHVECELAKERMHSSLNKLYTIVSPEFQGDAVVAYAEFEQSIETSEDQDNNLRASIEPMKDSAERFFEQWIADLKNFSNPEMRRRSQNRLNEARDRYEAIIATVGPAHSSYRSFNKSIKDVALFLSHDFNVSDEIQNDVDALAAMADELDELFDATLQSAQTYIQTADLPERAAPDGN